MLMVRRKKADVLGEWRSTSHIDPLTRTRERESLSYFVARAIRERENADGQYSHPRDTRSLLSSSSRFLVVAFPTPLLFVFVVVVWLFIPTDRAMLLSSNWVNMAIPAIHFPKRFVLNYNPLSASGFLTIVALWQLHLDVKTRCSVGMIFRAILFCLVFPLVLHSSLMKIDKERVAQHFQRESNSLMNSEGVGGGGGLFFVKQPKYNGGGLFMCQMYSKLVVSLNM